MPATITSYRWDELSESIMRLGIKSLSMDEMASILGISKKTLYERVENKEDLIRMVLAHYMEKDQRAMQALLDESHDAIHEMHLVLGHISAKIGKLSHACMFDLRKYYPEQWQIMDDFRRKSIFEKISNNIRRGQPEGLYRENIDVDLIASLYRFIVTSIVDDITKIKDFSKVEIFKEFMKYHLHGICTSTGHQKLVEHGFI